MNPHASHYYGKRRPEIKRGLLSPYDTSIEDFYGLTLQELREIPLQVQDEDVHDKFIPANIQDIHFDETKRCFMLEYLVKSSEYAPRQRFTQHLVLNNLIIHKNLPLENTPRLAFLYSDDFVARQYAHACPDIAGYLLKKMETFRFNPEKTKRTLKLLKDIFIHTLRPFTVDCPHADMNEAMDEIAAHMHNHFFAGDILIHRNNASLVEAGLVKAANKDERWIDIYYPVDDVTVRERLPLRGQIIGYYSSDRFAYGDLSKLLLAYRSDIKIGKYSKQGEDSNLALFLNNPNVSKFYASLTGEVS
ncbi:hypothetical protein [Ewingella americana]|uniref:Uncharacterized protein n=1 Tax=Ewingella americana TaxID=41202 RepID=A0A502GFY4_9GAMM|nr:hypothetical protein [Ewingella americana]TPG59906.1 hypothetical protein EAH77_15175 [Ewingella americana]